MTEDEQVAQYVIREAIESADFDTAMIRLTACLPFSLDTVTQAFKQWVNTTTLPWQVAVDYCMDRVVRGKSLPFQIGNNKEQRQ